VRAWNTFIAALAICFCLITVVMAAYGVTALDAYFAVYTITLLVLTTLYMFLSPRARRELNKVGIGAFGGFMIIVAFKVFQILSGK
jgi:hypothetical protein